MIMPTTLDIGLLPLASNNYDYVESTTHLEGLNYKNISMELTKFDNHVLTFGIYGRDFNKSSAAHFNAVLMLAIISVFVHFI